MIKGGHGVPEKLILKRYRESLINLENNISKFDEVILYDNTILFKTVYDQKGKIINREIDQIPKRAKNAISIDQKELNKKH